MTLPSEQASTVSFRLAEILANTGERVVFAESCTAGLVSTMLAAVPGASRFHCGSAVTYREETKSQWLGVTTDLIQRHTAVSAEVTRMMAENVLQRTPEASLSAAITGHLGPDSPPDLDGQVFVSIARRGTPGASAEILITQGVRLQSADRISRQREAAVRVLKLLVETLSQSHSSSR